MIIEPKIRGFVCTTAHPNGCAAHVQQQIDYVKSHGPITGPKNVLVIGASTGYGLAARITAAFGAAANTVGVFLEREPNERRTATAGWYNTVAFERASRRAGLKSFSINGDAFSDEIKAQTVAAVKSLEAPIDLVVYSLAAPKRTHPQTGETAKSVLKPIGDVYHGKTLNTDTGEVHPISIEPANEQEIADTISVMGGDDWALWMKALRDANALTPDCKTVAFTYIGPKLTWPIYWEGTIGRAKDDLDRTARDLDTALGAQGKADIAVMKGLVTQASSAIPVVPLYISILFRVMEEKGIHEGCIEQLYRLFSNGLYGSEAQIDDSGRIRMDDWEMREDVQAEVDRIWPQIETANLNDLSDFAGYRADFLKLFGFGLDGIDYGADVDPVARWAD